MGTFAVGGEKAYFCNKKCADAFRKKWDGTSPPMVTIISPDSKKTIPVGVLAFSISMGVCANCGKEAPE